MAPAKNNPKINSENKKIKIAQNSPTHGINPKTFLQSTKGNFNLRFMVQHFSGEKYFIFNFVLNGVYEIRSNLFKGVLHGTKKE